MNADATLTKRESEIAEWLAWGATKKDIANSLFISVRTVENTARSIYEKTGVTKSNELSAWWFCTHFKISFDLSPLVRSVIAIAFLFIVIPSDILNQPDICKIAKRTGMSRSGRRRGDDFDCSEFCGFEI